MVKNNLIWGYFFCEEEVKKENDIDNHYNKFIIISSIFEI